MDIDYQNKGMNEWTNERMIKWMNDQMNEWSNERMIKRMSDIKLMNVKYLK